MIPVTPMNITSQEGILLKYNQGVNARTLLNIKAIKFAILALERLSNRS